MLSRKKRRTAICFFVTFVFLSFTPGTVSWGADVDEILERVHERYAQKSFEAAFFQESHLKAMDMVDTAQGRLYFKPPGMMRWHYETPEEYFIITDGMTVWIYKPADKQVMTGRAADYLGSDRGPDYFANPKELAREFSLQLKQDTGEKDHHVLRLTPKTKRPDLTELVLFISKATSEISQAVTFNDFGDVTSIRFRAYNFTEDLDPTLFTCDIPKGVEILKLEEQLGR